MSQSKKQKTKKQVLRGREDIDQIFDLNKSEQKEIDLDHLENEWTPIASISKMQKRKSLLPIPYKSISPIECVQSNIINYEVKDYQNIYSNNFGFMLENIDEIKMGANSTCKILTNHIFKPHIVKKKVGKEEVEIWKELESKMRYFLVSESCPEAFIQTQVTHGMLTDLLSKQIFLNVANYSDQEIILHSKTPLCKIFFYFDKQVIHPEETLI